MPEKIIIDTDMSIDVDDVGALCIAHVLSDLHETRLLAVVHDAALETGVAAIASINSYFGRADIPIGAYRGPVGTVQSVVVSAQSIHVRIEVSWCGGIIQVDGRWGGLYTGYHTGTLVVLYCIPIEHIYWDPSIVQ